jgi:alpha 1,3-glucosidase
MNEPAVSSGPENTFPKGVVQRTSDGTAFEHREVHNMYGLHNAAGTFRGLTDRRPNYRPFILSRSFFAGSQKFAWTWTGDVTSSWDELAASLPNVVLRGLGGVPFTGADVGGFFGDPTAQLITRWFQMGAWCYPFFREHADLRSKLREPYLWRAKYRRAMVRAIEHRYRLVPMWYTAMKHTNETGDPIVKPLWAEFPEVGNMHTVETEVLVADSLLVAPVAKPGTHFLDVVKPPGRWFSFFTHDELKADVAVLPGLDDVPVYIRGGRIVPEYSEVGMSTREMLGKPISLHVALDENDQAASELYLDDGETYNYTRGSFLRKRLSFANGTLTCANLKGGKAPKEVADTIIERVFVYGDAFKSYTLNVRLDADFSIVVAEHVPVAMPRKSHFPVLLVIGAIGVVLLAVGVFAGWQFCRPERKLD